ncbi:glycosyltransferase family 4 protein [Spirosoma luteum]|uniref:glycosyltransferase family 4 protein n=1 Tax=Spirosoma luteum TaxID=431553 RepID=UPI0003732CBF|nr:glycosyltransferase family 4 protein [Spirosoma luteum]
MNVLITTVLVNHSPSGVVMYYNRLAEDLQKQGMTVRILDASDTPFTWRKCMGLLKRLMHPFGPASRALFEEFAYFTSMYWTVRGHRNEKFDLIHAQDAKSGGAAFLALNKRVPAVLSCHFNDSPVSELVSRFPMNSWFERRFSTWYRYLFSHIKNYVFTSGYGYQKSQHLLPDDIKKITIYNTVNIDNAADIVSRNQDSQLIISNVGYIDERKNQKLLIQIGHKLRERGINNFIIWLIGDGPKRVEYEALVEHLGLGEQIKFCGRQTDSWRLVAQSDLYIHTALNDNCPYAIIEALAVQTPVLALPVGGVPEMLPANFGLLNGNNLNTLTDEVAIYFDASFRRELKRAQADFADQHFNHPKSVTELVSFYHQIQQAA